MSKFVKRDRLGRPICVTLSTDAAGDEEVAPALREMIGRVIAEANAAPPDVEGNQSADEGGK